uniref:polynucleotide adenylyltransferase n=1 Tax=Oryza meridionalis TaxID=40149 RepID=A0A0E0CZN9_9ORYZ
MSRSSRGGRQSGSSATRMASWARPSFPVAPPPPMGRPPPPPPPAPPMPPVPVMYLRGVPPPPPWLPHHLIICGLDPADAERTDAFRSKSLLNFISRTGVLPSPEEELKRQVVVRELNKIVMGWAKRVAYDQREQYWNTTATVLTFGSYALGAYGPESDIDAVCVGPCIASLQHHFFIVLRQMLEERPEVSDLHSIESAKAIHAFDPRLLAAVNEPSWRCLSGVRVNRQIMQLLPNIKKFQILLRCLKLWARKRGLHCHLLGFFAGIHLAILAAFVCIMHPHATLSSLFNSFFDIFSHWHWPLPVSLLDQPTPWSPHCCSFMPIVMPCSPPEFCASSITRNTFNKIKEELQRGFALTKGDRNGDINWTELFAPFPYTVRYKHFLRIVLSAPVAEELRDWVGWVKSRFRNLLLRLESIGVDCDPDPSEQADHSMIEPNVVFFWGLMYRTSTNICIDSVKEDFMKSVTNDIYGKEKCTHSDITMSIVWPTHLPKCVYAHSVYSQNRQNPRQFMMGNQLMNQDCSAVR